MNKPSATLVNGLALLVIVGIIGSVWGLGWVSDKQMKVNRPTAIHVGTDGHVYIATTNDILVTRPSGELVSILSLHEMGIEGTVTQVETLSSDKLLLAASANNGFSWVDFSKLFASEGKKGKAFEGGIYECRPESSSCKKYINPEKVTDDAAATALFFAVDNGEGRVFVTNPWQQSIDVYDQFGQLIRRNLTTDKTGLLYPNTMRVMEDHALLVADTNHHRAVLIDTDQSGGGVTWSLDVKSAYDGGRYWRPISILPVDNTPYWWAVNATSDGSQSELMMFHDSDGLEKRIDLGEGADPIAIEKLGDGMYLTAIQSTPKLLLIDADGNVLGGFGDAKVGAYFSDVLKTMDFYQQMQKGVYLVLSLLLMLMLYVARLDQKRRSN